MKRTGVGAFLSVSERRGKGGGWGGAGRDGEEGKRGRRIAKENKRSKMRMCRGRGASKPITRQIVMSQNTLDIESGRGVGRNIGRSCTNVNPTSSIRRAGRVRQRTRIYMNGNMPCRCNWLQGTFGVALSKLPTFSFHVSESIITALQEVGQYPPKSFGSSRVCHKSELPVSWDK